MGNQSILSVSEFQQVLAHRPARKMMAYVFSYYLHSRHYKIITHLHTRRKKTSEMSKMGITVGFTSASLIHGFAKKEEETYKRDIIKHLMNVWGYNISPAQCTWNKIALGNALNKDNGSH